MTVDQPSSAQTEARTASFLFTFALVLLAVTLVLVLIWGLPALAMLGLAGTLAMFCMLIAYAAGF